MKIIFCSNVHGQTGVTANMLTTALLSDILYDKKSILLQTQPKLNQLEIPLLEGKKRKELLKQNLGMDMLIKNLISGKCTKEIFGNCCVSLLNSSMHFIPGSDTADRTKHIDAIAKTLHDMLSLAEELYEIVFLDAGVMPGKIADILFKEADKIVICLNQNKRVLDEYFAKGIEYDKIIYVIGNYDKCSINDYKYLMKSYTLLNKDNTFLIPYNTELRDALSESNLFTYFYRNITCDSSDYNFEFMQSALKLTRFINQ